MERKSVLNRIKKGFHSVAVLSVLLPSVMSVGTVAAEDQTDEAVEQEADAAAPDQVETSELGEPTVVRTLIRVRAPKNMENYANTLTDFEKYPLILTNQVTGETFTTTLRPSEENTSNDFDLETYVHAYERGNQPSGVYRITLPQELIDLGYSLTREQTVQANFGIVGTQNLSYNAPQNNENLGELSKNASDYGYLIGRDLNITLTSLDGQRTYALGNRDLTIPSGQYNIRITNTPADSRPQLILRESSLTNAPEREIELTQDGDAYVGTIALDFTNSTRPQIFKLSPVAIEIAQVAAPEVYDVATRKEASVEGITPEGATEIRVYLPGDSEAYRVANILSENPFTGERAFRLPLPEEYAFEAGQEVRVTAVDEAGNESEATVKTVIDSDALVQFTVDPIYPQASTISGTVNPEAESVQVYLPNGAMVSGSLQDDGTWSANLFSNASQLTVGETIDVRVRIDGNTHYYTDEFVVEAPEDAAIDLEQSNLVIARLGYYGDRYYRATVTLVDEYGRPVTGLTEEDFHIDTFGGIVNFSADGNVYRLDTAEADVLRPNASLEIRDGTVHVIIEDERAPEVDVSALEELIAEAESYSNEEGQYSEESYAALQEAIAEARAALGTIETEEELADAVDALQAAIAGLEEAPEEPEKSHPVFDTHPSETKGRPKGAGRPGHAGRPGNPGVSNVPAHARRARGF